MSENYESPQLPPSDLPECLGAMERLRARVESRELAPTDISLTPVARQYADYLEHAGAVDLEAAGHFLRASSWLLLQKSQLLFPRPEEEAEPEAHPLSVSALIGRQALSAASLGLRRLEGRESFSSPPRSDIVERRSGPRSSRPLLQAWSDLQRRQNDVQVSVAAPAFARLETALSGLLRRIRAGRSLSLHKLLRRTNRHDAVVHFLAVLELLRRRQASAYQGGLFADIVIERVDDGVEGASRAG